MDREGSDGNSFRCSGKRNVFGLSPIDRRNAMDKTIVKCFKNGPYEIQGEVEITDANGKKVSKDGSGTYHLCRCGGSSKKPFCDGTHSRIQFKSE